MKATEQWVRVYGPLGNATRQIKDWDVEMLAKILTDEVRWSWVKYNRTTFEFENVNAPSGTDD